MTLSARYIIYHHCDRIRSFSRPYCPYFDWIRRDTVDLSVFSPNAGKYKLEKLRIRTLSQSLHEWYLFHLSYLIELSPWTNFTDCSEDIVCNGNGKRYRNRSCDHDQCCDRGIFYKKGDHKIDVQNCQFTCASKIHLFLSF